MISYDLAKELKDAGFPQLHEIPRSGAQGSYLPEHGIVSETAYVPTLEELIEACGRKFGWLRLNIDGTWVAYSDYLKAEELGRYTTPTESVARLWLALNKEV